MPRRAPIALALVVCAGVGCSLTTSLDGLTGGGAAGADAGPGADAGARADSGARADGAPADAGGAYAAAVLADAPMAYWRLDETSGATAHDEVGDAHPGTFEGTATYGVPGAVGDGHTAIGFDGSSTRLDVGAAFGFAPAAPFSIEAWIAPAPLDGQVRWIVNRDTLSGTSEGYDLYYGDTFLLFSRTAGGTEGGYANASAPTPGVFAQVVMVFDGTSDHLFVDAVEVDHHPSPGSIGAGGQRLVIGDKARAQAFKFHGVIDEVAVYAKALSAAQIAAHYHAAGR